MTTTEESMEITPAELLAQLRVIAEKKMAENDGVDYVYEKQPESDCACLYAIQTDMGLQPSCIIGHWAHQDHGVELKAFETVEGCGAGAALRILGVLPPVIAPETDRLRNTDTQNVANYVQQRQDKGVGWLAAVNEAEEWVREGYCD